MNCVAIIPIQGHWRGGNIRETGGLVKAAAWLGRSGDWIDLAGHATLIAHAGSGETAAEKQE